MTGCIFWWYHSVLSRTRCGDRCSAFTEGSNPPAMTRRSSRRIECARPDSLKSTDMSPPLHVKTASRAWIAQCHRSGLRSRETFSPIGKFSSLLRGCSCGRRERSWVSEPPPPCCPVSHQSVIGPNHLVDKMQLSSPAGGGQSRSRVRMMVAYQQVDFVHDQAARFEELHDLDQRTHVQLK